MRFTVDHFGTLRFLRLLKLLTGLSEKTCLIVSELLIRIAEALVQALTTS